MNLGILDIVLIFSFFYLLFAIISNHSTPNLSSTNIIFDDDIILVNSNNELNSDKSNFENKKIEKNNNSKNQLVSANKDNTKNNISSTQTQNIINNQIKNTNLDLKSIDDIILDELISNSANNNLPVDIKAMDKKSDRYNRLYNNSPDESDLINIRNFDILSNDTLYDYDRKAINDNNMSTLHNTQNIDSKIFNKSNKSQKLFKDAKTIAGRFTKNSIIEDYKHELNYYEKTKTPWWE